MNKLKLLALTGLMALTYLPPSISAAQLPYDTIIFFGDSLSDNGNFFHRTMGYVPKSPPYFEGRFSNGPIWSELVAEHYKEKNRVEADNYAVGSSSAIFHNPAKGYLPYTLKMAVYNYLVRYTGYDKTHTLYTIWIGANDYFYGADDVDNATDAVMDGLSGNIESLINRGGKYFLLMNLPDIGKTPYGRDNGDAEIISALIVEHNRKLAILVDKLQKENPDITIRLYDIYNDFVSLTNDPDAYNKKYNIHLTDLSESCWPGGYTLKRNRQIEQDALTQDIKDYWQQNGKPLTRGNAPTYDNADQLAATIMNTPALTAAYDVAKQYKEGQKSCTNPDNHVFWDKVHPSRVVHNTFSLIMIDYIDQNFNKISRPK